MSTYLEHRLAVTHATESSLFAALIAGLTQILALAVGFGVLNNTQSGAIIALTTAGINAGALIAHAIHTGRIVPSALQTHLLALGAQLVALLVSFALIGPGTAATVTSITTAVLGAAFVVAHAMLSHTVTPAPPKAEPVLASCTLEAKA